MSTTYGLVPQGFYPKTISAILSDVGSAELAQISSGINLQPTALMGILNGVFCQPIADLWMLGLALYSGMSPSAASGDQLASLALITGTKRGIATPTRISGVVVNVAAGFSCDPGDLVATLSGNTTVQFSNLEALSNPTGSAVNLTCTFACSTTGPISAPAGTLTIRAQSFSGWNTVTNPNDGVIGTDIQTDAGLRDTRALELASSGSTTDPALRADLLAALTPGGTKSISVLRNNGDGVDANGLPTHCIEVIAYLPGNTEADDQALAELIYQLKADGINTHGTSNRTVQDTSGNYEVIYFTRPDPVDFYVVADLASNSQLLKTIGRETIRGNAVTAVDGFLNAEVVAQEVYWKHVQAELFVGGIDDVNSFAIGTSPSPSSAINFPMPLRSIPIISAENITVTVDGL